MIRRHGAHTGTPQTVLQGVLFIIKYVKPESGVGDHIKANHDVLPCLLPSSFAALHWIFVIAELLELSNLENHSIRI